MWTLITTIFDAIVGWFLHRQTNTDNVASKSAADIARETEQHDDEIHDEAAANVVKLHAADSVQQRNKIASDAIDSANGDVRGDKS